IVKLMLNALVMASVDQDQANARVQERELAIAVLELLEIEVGDLEGLGAGQESDARPLLALRGRADDLQGRFGVAVTEAHEMLFAVTPDGEVEPFAERVDDRHPDAVEAAGNFVGIVVTRVLELTASVELGHDDLGSRDPLFLMDVGRNAAAIIFDRDRPVGIQLDDDAVAVAG